MRGGRLAWGSFAATAALIVGGLVLGALTPPGQIPASVEASPLGEDAAFGTIMLAFAFVGALVAARVPSNPVGWLLCAVGALNGLWMLGAAYAEYAYFGAGRDLPGPAEAAWLGNLANDLQWGLSLLMLMLFPDGRLPSRRWWPVAALVVAPSLAVVLDSALQPGPLEGFAVATNPAGVESAAWLRDVDFDLAANLLLLVPVAALVAKRRRAGTEMRRQLKGFFFALALVAVGIAGFGLATSIHDSAALELAGTAVVMLLFANLAGALAVAVLRHRLYDVDLVIRRTLVYGALSATLAAGYLCCVLLAQLVIGARSDLAIAASTLAMAALFGPARARIQAGVDRRFYRRRYDAQRTLEALGARLRGELDLDEMSADVRRVVDETLQPAHLSLWLRGAR